MKRADAQKAVDAAFIDALDGAYRNLVNGFFSLHPERENLGQQFRNALAKNIAAHKVASAEIAASPDLQD